MGVYVTGFAETFCILLIFVQNVQIKMILTKNHLNIFSSEMSKPLAETWTVAACW
jgi:hypothetical protein